MITDSGGGRSGSCPRHKVGVRGNSTGGLGVGAESKESRSTGDVLELVFGYYRCQIEDATRVKTAY